MVLLHEEEEEDERNQRGTEAPHSSEPQRHIPLVSLLLWRKMVAVHPFVLGCNK